MVDAEQARAWEVGPPTLGLMEWLRAWLASWSARFDSWKTEGDEDDLLTGADPEMVAALQFLASLLPNDESDTLGTSRG